MSQGDDSPATLRVRLPVISIQCMHAARTVQYIMICAAAFQCHQDQILTGKYIAKIDLISTRMISFSRPEFS